MSAKLLSAHGVTHATAVTAAVLVGTAALVGALILGPKPLVVAEERTGDPQLAGRIAELSESGHHHLASFTITDGVTDFAGLGAGERTEFEIGSVTKTFTAEILRGQIATGRVSADTAVGEIIEAGDSPIGDVTLLELAEHTSGLPRLAGGGFFRGIIGGFLGTNPYEGITRDDIIDAALEADLSDRGKEEYSNFGFALLGQLLAIEAGTSYEELVTDQILDPLGMTDTYLMTDGRVAEDAPRGHLPSGRTAEPWEMGGYTPAGGIRSTPADMARYAHHLLEADLPGYTWVEDDAGFSWHNGGTYGFSTMLIIDPAAGRAAFGVGDTMTGVESLTAALIGEEF